jgi:hypothetical protein
LGRRRCGPTLHQSFCAGHNTCKTRSADGIAVLLHRFGVLGFGGPVALVGQMEREVVAERDWLTALIGVVSLAVLFRADLSVALRMVLSLEGIACRPK